MFLMRFVTCTTRLIQTPLFGYHWNSKPQVILKYTFLCIEDIRFHSDSCLIAKCIIVEPSDYLISHLFGDISIVDREKYPLNFCEKPLQMSSFSCKTKLDSMPCTVSGMSISIGYIQQAEIAAH